MSVNSLRDTSFHRHVAVSRSLVALSVAATIAGLAVRFMIGPLGFWLDEAQSVSIAGLGTTEMIAALAADGHPPLYYLGLHLWMDLVGNSDSSIRLASAILGVGAVAVIGLVGRRVGGTATALIAVALASTSPFLVRYSTEARMYSLLTLLACLWWLAVERASERPSHMRLGIVAISVSALLYTHYWSFFLLAGWGIVTLVGRRLFSGSGPKLALAHILGALPFALWAPTLIHQVTHTGTPWAGAPNPASIVVNGFADLSGGSDHTIGLAALGVYTILLLVGLTGQNTERGHIRLDVAGASEARPLASLVASTILIAVVVVVVTDSAFASRYLAIVAGFLVVLMARGIAQISPAPAQVLVLLVASVVGLGGAWHATHDQRSQGRDVAAHLAEHYQPGDIVLVCPDQLGPATARYLPSDMAAVAYPLSTSVDRVDWTDYADRHAKADPSEFLDELLPTEGAVWLVWNSNYRTLEGQCRSLHDQLWTGLGGADVIGPAPDTFEPMWLSVFGRP